jgi:cyclophilin family peptidyl-prolyl cis-trans isomerase
MRAARTLAAAVAAATFLAGLACGWRESGRGPEVPREIRAAAALLREGPHDLAVLEVEGLGEIRIELLPELAPSTVARFQELVSSGFYDGVTFHRVVPGFVIQAGCPLTRNADPRDDGKGGSGTTQVDEFTDLPQVRGVVAMAHKGNPGSADSQFYIVHEDSRFLDGDYTAFGRVVSGMDVVDAITRLEIDTYGRYGPPSRPYPKDARIASARIEPPAARHAHFTSPER